MKTMGTMLVELSLMLKIVWSDVVASKGIISIAITIPFIKETPVFSDSMLVLTQFSVL